MSRMIVSAMALALALAGCGQDGQELAQAGQQQDRHQEADQHHDGPHDQQHDGRHDGHARWQMGELEISAPWSRAIPPAAPVAAGYLSIRNRGSGDDRLVEVRSDAAARVEIHELRDEDGMARMRQLPDGLSLPAGETVELRPGGYHLMFITPADGFVAGRQVAATLVFEHAGELPVEFEVRPIGAQSAGEGHDHH